ncbi:hypothetical protein AAC03nite_35180 [Alicyclobacillus acidoterrestris]|nr:hypothetical protein AAC03nite_35180 [Alicyclobacillus acidoterrestris]
MNTIPLDILPMPKGRGECQHAQINEYDSSSILGMSGYLAAAALGAAVGVLVSGGSGSAIGAIIGSSCLLLRCTLS